MIMEDVVFRSVKPEQIQMAIAAQAAEDDTKFFEVEWSPVTLSEPVKEEVWLVIAEDRSEGRKEVIFLTSLRICESAEVRM